MGKMRSAVLPCCLMTPLRRVVTVTGVSRGLISLETMGPAGQKVSKPLARLHWPSDFWRSRAVTSLTMV